MNVIEVVAQEAGEPGAVLPHLSEIIIGFIAFSALVYVLSKYAWPHFTKSHVDATQRITSGMQRAEQAETDAQQELARNRAKLAEADNEAARIRDDARADAERIKQDMAERADEEAKRVVAQGRQSLDASRSQAVSELRSDVGRQSVELARRIVASSLADEGVRSRSVDQFLDGLESMSADGTGSSASSSGNGSNVGTTR